MKSSPVMTASRPVKPITITAFCPAFLREKMIYPLIEALPDQPQKKGLINILKRFVEGSHLPLDGGHLRWQYFSSDEQDARLYNDRFKKQVRMDPFAPLRGPEIPIVRRKSDWTRRFILICDSSCRTRS